MLKRENLQERTVAVMKGENESWLSRITPRFLAVGEGVTVEL